MNVQLQMELKNRTWPLESTQGENLAWQQVTRGGFPEGVTRPPSGPWVESESLLFVANRQQKSLVDANLCHPPGRPPMQLFLRVTPLWSCSGRDLRASWSPASGAGPKRGAGSLCPLLPGCPSHCSFICSFTAPPAPPILILRVVFSFRNRKFSFIYRHFSPFHSICLRAQLELSMTRINFSLRTVLCVSFLSGALPVKCLAEWVKVRK